MCIIPDQYEDVYVRVREIQNENSYEESLEKIVNCLNNLLGIILII